MGNKNSTKKIVTVFGATGKQGGSVCRALATDCCKRYPWHVRAVTRNPDSESAAELKKLKNCEVIKGDLTDKESIKAAIDGSWGVFLVTQFWEKMDSADEKTQGTNVADAILEFKASTEEGAYKGPEFLVFSGLEKTTKRNVPHFDIKGEIEDYIREKEIPCCTVRVPFYLNNFLDMLKMNKGEEEGTYVVGIPLGDATIDLMGIEDLGACVKSVFEKPEEYTGKTICLSAQKATTVDICEAFSEALAPKKFIDPKISLEAFRKLGFPGAEESANMFEYLNENQERGDVEMTKKLHPKILSAKQWAVKNKDKLAATL